MGLFVKVFGDNKTKLSKFVVASRGNSMQDFQHCQILSRSMTSIRPLIPLLIAAGILLAGNGLQGTFIAIRGAEEGFSASLIGFMGTAYFTGFLLGCVAIPRLLQSVGHIRTFAALAAIATAGTIMMVLWIDATWWIVSAG